MEFVLPPPAISSLPVRGSAARFPVHRIYCVGRNFSEHAREMGMVVDRGLPVFFCKPADAVVAPGDALPFPPATADLHHEVELVVALGRDADGEVALASALELVYGHSVGLDLTRRDLQAIAKSKGMPWDTAKAFDHSAPVGELHASGGAGLPQGELWLQVNGQRRQQGRLDDMVFSVAEVIQHLSRLFDLRAGDLIFMGTPAGVAALQPGDRCEAGIDAETYLAVTMGAPRAR